MTAVEALRLAGAAGVRIGIDGGTLTLEADAAPPREVIDLLARFKVEVIALLRPDGGGWWGGGRSEQVWSEEDWRAYFDERAGIAEFDGALSPEQAEAVAFAGCIAEWLRRNPVSSSPRLCSGCNGPEHRQGALLTCGLGTAGHAWLHSHCRDNLQAGWNTQAVVALAAFGIRETRPSP